MVKKRSKYGNRKFIADGYKWDSEREYVRWKELCLMQDNGLVSELNRQVVFELIPAICEDVLVVMKTKTKTKRKTVQRPINFIVDFTYMDSDGNFVAEDVKIAPHMLPKEYVLKKKMLRFFHGIELKEYYGKEKDRRKSQRA